MPFKKSSVAAWCICHYGKPYIAASVAALYDQVDKIFIAYTDKPSQSFGTTMACPDTKEELLKEIEPYMDKVEWMDGSWEHEWQHCDAARAMAAGYEWLVRFDTDEIYPRGAVKYWVSEAAKTKYKEWRIEFKHFWRSFSKFCYDQSWPVRIEHTTSGEGLGWLPASEKHAVCHMGYAMPVKYIDYKMSVSGHKSEWRPDWFVSRFLVNAQKDVHPVCWNPPLWNTEDYDKTKLPPQLKSHPFYNLDVIEWAYGY